MNKTPLVDSSTEVMKCLKCWKDNRERTLYCRVCRLYCSICKSYHNDNKLCDEFKRVITFGKHSGKSLNEILDVDKSYLNWMTSEISWLQHLRYDSRLG